jgi:EpsI family protein
MTAMPATHVESRVGLARPSRRDLIAGSLLLAVSAASVGLKPKRMFKTLTHDELGAAIPMQVGAYRFATTSGLVLPPSDELSERLYDQVLTRVYAAPGKLPIMALFAYGSVQNLSLELHRPDECYPQQGFTITKPETLPLTFGGHRIPASILSADRPDGYAEQVLFWSRIGGQFPPDRTAQSLLVARENFAGRMPDGLLVRLSVPTTDRVLALGATKEFLDALDRELTPLGRRIVFGETAKDVRTA